MTSKKKTNLLAALDASSTRGADSRGAAERRAAALREDAPDSPPSDPAPHPQSMPIAESAVPPGKPDPVVTGPAQAGVQDVPLMSITDNPFNARRVYRDSDIEGLADSFQKYGQQSAARGFWRDGKCVLIYGHRRKRAALQLGWNYLKVDLVAEPEGDKALYLASREENAQRSAQTLFDDALVWHDLLDKGVYATQEELADSLKISQPVIAKTLSLRKLPMHIMKECIAKDLTSRAVLYALSQYHDDVGDEQNTMKLIEEASSKGMSSRDVEARVRYLKERRRAGNAVIPKPRSESYKFTYGNKDGILKEFVTKGRVELRIDGLDEETRTALVDQLRRILPAQA
ncbi:ParB/RepB/Spo0J family partition protein [Noviherbaspirillum suwonense]|uniref:Chromosome partitioning protein, ParB family n=1 Tax=Noviherbaspirillum suwonense TaxID=1224511 RepID=A0ABY1QUZ2_9BURK|nr:ParB/RepB/Spo0J family partition protein [Noviherbaspirillum suwonense]SMP79672.1 chromosome partitioning protein, ParB family [Noviherbaspirillum suwonense]